MNGKVKKSKHKSHGSDDLNNIKVEKKVAFGIPEEKDEGRTSSIGSSRDFVPTRKRNHTKVRRNKHHKEKEEFTEDIQNGRKIKFGKIDIIDVESWKQLNLKMTAEENLDELLKISEGKKERMKNISCSCAIM